MSLHYLVKYRCSKNRHAQEKIKADCRVRLIHSKNFILNMCLVKYSLVDSVTKRCSRRLYKNLIIDCTQLLWQRKRSCSKMPYMISSRSVTDVVRLSVLIYQNSLIFVDNKLTLISLLIWEQLSTVSLLLYTSYFTHLVTWQVLHLWKTNF